MNTSEAIRGRVESAPVGSVFLSSDFNELGAPTAIRPALSYLVGRGVLGRVRRGTYYRRARSGFGSGAYSNANAALRVANRLAPGPSGAFAAHVLGLSTQVPVIPEIAVVGRAPTSVPGVRFRERSNVERLRVNATSKEVALLELARENFDAVELSRAELITRVRRLLEAGEIDRDRLLKASEGEPKAARSRLNALLTA